MCSMSLQSAYTPEDNDRLIKILESLRNIGNTVLVVEHDSEMMRAADHIIDIGPFAGVLGGEVVFEGAYPQLLDAPTLTGRYLSGQAVYPFTRSTATRFRLFF